MAFVARTTRERNSVGIPRGATAAHVGPGAYSVGSGFGPKHPSYAPFAATSERTTIAQVSL